MQLAEFILKNIEPIAQEWEEFARTCTPGAIGMNKGALLDVLLRSSTPWALRHASELSEYTLLTKDAAEVQALAQDFLIRVTSFFRDPATFEGLAETVFPALFENRSHKIRYEFGSLAAHRAKSLFHRDCPAGVRNCKGISVIVTRSMIASEG
jgi:hypothetical protein